MPLGPGADAGDAARLPPRGMPRNAGGDRRRRSRRASRGARRPALPDLLSRDACQERGWFDLDAVAAVDHRQDDRAPPARLRRHEGESAREVKQSWETPSRSAGSRRRRRTPSTASRRPSRPRRGVPSDDRAGRSRLRLGARRRRRGEDPGGARRVARGQASGEPGGRGARVRRPAARRRQPRAPPRSTPRTPCAQTNARFRAPLCGRRAPRRGGRKAHARISAAELDRYWEEAKEEEDVKSPESKVQSSQAVLAPWN